MPLNLPNADRIRLLHMLEAARLTLRSSIGKDRSSLDSDPVFQRAVVGWLQDIGEAAARVSDPTRTQIPTVPWQQIVGMRHRLVHVYFHIDHDIVWGVIQTDLPSLVASLEPIIQSASSSTNP
jgi:uncharacterized protein with HEPN domain